MTGNVHMKRIKLTAGFTIVELLIVVVVIAILAAITIVSYNGITVSANDALRRDGAAKLARAYKAWISETGQTPYQLGCGANNAGNGFIQYRDADGSGGLYEGPTCIDILAEKGLISANFTNTIPTNTLAPFNTKNRMYMLYHCTQAPANRALLLWHLQKPTSEETANITQLASGCASGGVIPYATYGMVAGELISW